MGVRVLLIEDDETIAEPLADGLRHFGLTVHHVATGADGLRGPHGDVVLLDLGLPDMDGIDVCRGIRRTSDVPIIILSARGEEADRVLGLELGADDYLAKPFSIRELVARIRAVSRRHQRMEAGAAWTTGPVPGAVPETAPGSGTAPGATSDPFGQPGRPAVPAQESADWAEPAYPARAAGTGSDFGAPAPRVGASAAYDWTAAYETPAHGTPTQAPPAHGTPPHGTPMFGTPAHGTPVLGTPAVGAPPHGTPVFSTPAHSAPDFGSRLYGAPAHGTPVYEPPTYEQAPPEPRAPSSGSATTGSDDRDSAPSPGPLVVDRRTRQVWVGEAPIALTPKEFELLALLTEDPGAVYSRQQILNRVWDDHYQGPTKTLDVHVATLRRKLGDPAWIQTLRGVGFRLAVRTPGQGPGRHRTPEARAS
ncbi:winged helix-turn-helix domain-containing protein [Streptomyces ipomoeae]|nr:winged helix-turn-helix domain-containing protein [Streptomyces ipomoeae]MDX2845467.1 winged helix-turn-helix domain-containing protein [Streptomyces ipomoeae]MDX2879880.1 winged helix-turn-helix domain-containing protein [Streptomyces ipomoeae]